MQDERTLEKPYIRVKAPAGFTLKFSSATEPGELIPIEGAEPALPEPEHTPVAPDETPEFHRRSR